MIRRLASSKAMWARISKRFKVRNTGFCYFHSRKNSVLNLLIDWNDILRNSQCRLKWHFPKFSERGQSRVEPTFSKIYIRNFHSIFFCSQNFRNFWLKGSPFGKSTIFGNIPRKCT